MTYAPNFTHNPAVLVEKTGVYVIRNLVNGRVYVGSAARTIRERWNQHRHYLRSGKHHSQALQRAWVKYGEAAFEFVILEECEPTKCIEREQWYIDTMKAAIKGFGYNINPVAGSPLGRKATAATRAKLSASKRGHKPSAETRRKFSDNMKAAWADSENRERIKKFIAAGRTPQSRASQAAKVRGRKHTPEAIAKIGAASRALTPEKREEMRQAMLTSDASRSRRANMIGRMLRPETVARMSASKKGIPKTPEHNAKTSAAITEWHRKRRRVTEWIDTHLGMRPSEIDWSVAA